MGKRRRAKSSSEYEWERCVACKRKVGYSFTIIRGVGSFCERCMYEKQDAMLIRNEVRAMGGSACSAPVGIEQFSKEACVENVDIDGIEVKMATVHSCKSLIRLVEWLKLRVPPGLKLAFRGQYRDYGQRPLKATRKIRLLPSVLRSRRKDISADIIGAELRAWVKALADEYPGYNCTIVIPKHENSHERNKVMFAWLRTREDFLAVAMHYGYPTTYLDVSSDLKVAVWFATHRYFLKDGLVRHKAVHAKGTNKFLWPSVYVLVADPEDLIDITRADPSGSRTNRSHRQSAIALAYGSVLGADPYSGLVTMMMDKSASVIPWLVIKLSPEFDWEQMGLAGHEHYFPDIKHDRTYAALLRAKVPRLAIYAAV